MFCSTPRAEPSPPRTSRCSWETNEPIYAPGPGASPVAGTVFGPVGLYACMDGVTFEVPRTFAVRGARLLLNSLNSFALDEAALHIPVRAVENGVFVAAANKVGPLLPPERVPEFSKALGVPPEALEGAGESQITAPDGTVMAIGPRTGEAVVVADLDLSRSVPGRLQRRRPEVYGPLARPHTIRPAPASTSEVVAGCVPGAHSNPELVHDAIDVGAKLVVLPELTPVPDDVPPGVLVITTVLRDAQHIGQVWSAPVPSTSRCRSTGATAIELPPGWATRWACTAPPSATWR